MNSGEIDAQAIFTSWVGDTDSRTSRLHKELDGPYHAIPLVEDGWSPTSWLRWYLPKKDDGKHGTWQLQQRYDHIDGRRAWCWIERMMEV